MAFVGGVSGWRSFWAEKDEINNVMSWAASENSEYDTFAWTDRKIDG
jgi:hypothetical protein